MIFLRSTPFAAAALAFGGTRIALLAAALIWLAVTVQPPLNADAAAILQFAQRMAEGERLYIDLIDINPPLIFWLSAGAVAIGRAAGLETVTAAVVMIHLACAASLFAAYRLFHLSQPAKQPLARFLLPAAALSVVCLYPGQMFGEREHLLLISMMPYGALALLRSKRLTLAPGWSVGVGIAALIGMCLKPHFAAVPAAVEAGLIIALGPRRWLSNPAPWLLFIGGGSYIALTFWLYPVYFTEILPMATSHYGALDMSVLPSLLLGQQVPLNALALAGVSAFGWRDGPDYEAVRVLLALAFGATVAAALQWKDWDYHFLPARGFLILAAAAAASAIVGNWPAPTGRITRLAALLVAAGLFLAGFGSDPFLAQRRFASSESGRLLSALRGQAHGQRVLWLTQYIDPTAPVLNYLDARLAMPYMSMWLLAVLYEGTADSSGRIHFTPPDLRPPAERKMLEDVGASLERWHPRLILVAETDSEAAFRDTDFDYIRYFRQEPRFAAEWVNYERTGKIGGTVLYRRIEGR